MPLLTTAVEPSYEIPRTSRYRFSCPQEEASHLPSYVSPRRNCPTHLYAARGFDFSLVGPHYAELDCSCCYVLVLLPIRTGGSHLVEEIYHHASNSPIRHRSRLRLLRFIHLLHQHILSVDAEYGQMRRRRVCSVCRHGYPQFLLAPLHFFLLRNLQEGWPERTTKEKHWKGGIDRDERLPDSRG